MILNLECPGCHSKKLSLYRGKRRNDQSRWHCDTCNLFSKKWRCITRSPLNPHSPRATSVAYSTDIPCLTHRQRKETLGHSTSQVIQ